MAVVTSAAPMAVVERPTRSLTPGTDRCDRCGARAYVKVVFVNGGDLLFCGHHASEHERAYLRLAARVVDERSFIPT